MDTDKTTLVARTRSAVVGLCAVCLSVVVSAVLLESLLRTYHLWQSRSFQEQSTSAMYVSDPNVGIRPNPNYPGHDRRGWRNKDALTRADTVIFGDSQTYGLNASMDEAWPQQFAARTRQSTYQMAFSGFSPAHYLPLIDEALALRPKMIVASYYFGNDPLEAYWLTYNKGEIGFTRQIDSVELASLASRDAGVLRQIEEIESTDIAVARAQSLDCQALRPGLGMRFKTPYPLEVSDVVMDAWARSELAAFVSLRWSRVKARFSGGRDGENGGDRICVSFSTGAVRTVFSPAYRLMTLTNRDVRVREGRRINLAALDILATRLREEKVAFVVLLIPTKELVFGGAALGKVNDEPYLQELWSEERSAREEVIRHLADGNIAVVDALPELERLVATGTNPYKQAYGAPMDDADGHPVPAGYAAIAAAVQNQLRVRH